MTEMKEESSRGIRLYFLVVIVIIMLLFAGSRALLKGLGIWK